MNIIDNLYKLFLECDTLLTDSREVEPLAKMGKSIIFFALKGENFNGNNFVVPVLQSGAKYAVTDNKELVEVEGAILVDDVFAALTELACVHRANLKHTHLAITGSNGKTTTKELLAAVLNKKFNCYATKGNFNNHLGVPLTILRTPESANFSVIEMGANHCGEIAYLCNIASPDFGLITNIGKAHLEGFGGAEGVKRGKGELFDYLESNGGKAFYLRESEPISELVAEHSSLENIAYSVSDIAVLEGEKLTVRYGDTLISSNLVGDYNLFNIRAAIAVGEYFGVDLVDIKAAIEEYLPTNNRSQMVIRDDYRIIVDAYNANPSSMKLSLENFDKMEAENKIIIIGDMKELGDYSLNEHISILKQVENMSSSVSEVIIIGAEFAASLKEYSPKFNHSWFSDIIGVSSYISPEKCSSSLVLIKGSNSTRLFKLLEVI